jgi:arsenite-transporting ATPase
VLLISADPAHSVGDALRQRLSDQAQRVSGASANLLARELDAERAFAAVREQFATAIEELFARVSGGAIAGGVAAHDRQVMQDLIDLAPPGIDELVAIIEVMESIESEPVPKRRAPKGSNGSAKGFDLVVIDTAPTGHALRLIEMPALVHDWVKAVMAILLKYQPVVGLGDLGALLVRLSHGLGRLREVLADPLRTRFVAVTRPAALPLAETRRLLLRLDHAGVNVPVVVVNAVGAGTCTRCLRDAAAQKKTMVELRRKIGGRQCVVAPVELPPPQGAAALTVWRGAWREWLR